MRIAIMQPYFIPYAGYFRLFQAVDLFVMFDCVQFPRRGWMHRNRLYNAKRELQWLTLPLQKAPQTVKIYDLLFAEDSAMLWSKQLRSFPCLTTDESHQHPLVQHISYLTESPVDFIIASLKITCDILTLPFHIIRSSTLNLSAELTGAVRLIEIAKHFGAKEYINLAGGRELYQTDSFTKQGLKLRFLSPFQGRLESILQRLLCEKTESVRDDIVKQTKLDDLH